MIHIRRIRLYSLLGVVFFCAIVFYLNVGDRNFTNKNEIPIVINSARNISIVKKDINDRLIINDNFKPNKDKYIFPIEPVRINRLFKKLHEKEKTYHSILNLLELPSFEKIINKQKIDNFEYENYLDAKDDQVIATDKFIDYLNVMSSSHSFTPRSNISRSKILNDLDKPVIVTAANSHYYDPLQATVFHVHKYFPDYHLIVYDLGLEAQQYEKTKAKCKCEIKKYNVDNIYSKVSPHVSDLKKFSWKPLIIQETLLKHKTVLYIDSSIRFLNNEIAPIVNTCSNIGMLTQYIGLKLVCYTHPKMFEWFEEKPSSYEDFFTIEANILMFHQSFLTQILMKAWITCALESECIAPEGSSTGGCCGCHRYDQDGLTIVNSFFFGHPKDKNFLPAYSFTTQESYFFEIRRYQGMKYFD